MTELVPATSAQETPVFFPAGDETLFGVLTQPTGPAVGVAVVLIYGGGHNVSAHVGELWTRTARRVAALGLHAFRYDHHGNGDSTGRTGTFDHRYPFTADLRAAVDWLRTQGLERFVLVGDCLGARAALDAGTDMAGIEALFLMSPMVYDGRMGKDEEWAEAYGLGHYVRRALQWRTIRKLADPALRRAYFRVGVTKMRKVMGLSRMPGDSQGGDESSVSTGFLDPLGQVLGSGARVNFVFGTADDERRSEFEDARSGRLGSLLEEAGDRVEVSTVEGGIAAHMNLEAQEGLIDRLERWLGERVVAPAVGTSVRSNGATESPQPSVAHGPEAER